MYCKCYYIIFTMTEIKLTYDIDTIKLYSNYYALDIKLNFDLGHGCTLSVIYEESRFLIDDFSLNNSEFDEKSDNYKFTINSHGSGEGGYSVLTIPKHLIKDDIDKIKHIIQSFDSTTGTYENV